MATLILVLIDGTTQTLTARSVIRGTDRSGGLSLLFASVAATSCRHPPFVVAGLRPVLRLWWHSHSGLF